MLMPGQLPGEVQRDDGGQPACRALTVSAQPDHHDFAHGAATAAPQRVGHARRAGPAMPVLATAGVCGSRCARTAPGSGIAQGAAGGPSQPRTHGLGVFVERETPRRSMSAECVLSCGRHIHEAWRWKPHLPTGRISAAQRDAVADAPARPTACRAAAAGYSTLQGICRSPRGGGGGEQRRQM